MSNTFIFVKDVYVSYEECTLILYVTEHQEWLQGIGCSRVTRVTTRACYRAK